jgi:hypothetical protein
MPNAHRRGCLLGRFCRVSKRVIWEILPENVCKRSEEMRRSRVDHEIDTTPAARPKDARKATEEQRDLQEKLNHQDDDPDAPGLHQSRHDLPDETTR